jgi:ribosomal protein S6 kinase beta
MAPEMIKGNGYGKAVDWWSVGILIFDMLTGNPPFKHRNEGALQQKILNQKLRIPTFLTGEAHSIIKNVSNSLID